MKDRERQLIGTIFLAIAGICLFVLLWGRALGQRDAARREAAKWGVAEQACRERAKIQEEDKFRLALDIKKQCPDGSWVTLITTYPSTAEEEAP